MSDDIKETNKPASEFDFAAFPPNTLFHERRLGSERRGHAAAPAPPAPAGIEIPPRERRAKKERRRRIDPTTFEKQYTDDELEFMNAMQRFKELTGRAFPTYGDALLVAVDLGYRRVVWNDDPGSAEDETRLVISLGDSTIAELPLSGSTGS